MRCSAAWPFGRTWGVWGMVLAACATGPALADTIRVPADKPTIQAAIDAAKAGDIVLVADGTYTGPGNRDLDFRGLLITVQSEHGATKTTIDCQGAGRAAIFDEFEIPDTVLEGFTITGGVGAAGGGVLIVDSGPTIRNCAFKGNAATGASASDGGGAAAVSSGGNPRFLGCTFEGNSGRSGGAILLDTQSQPTIENCTFTSNTATASGGGVAYFDRSRGSVAGCTFSKNEGASGGGVYTAGLSGPSFLTCKFDQNRATAGNGGALLAESSSGPTFTGCVFTGNKAASGGAAAGNGAGLLSFTNGVFTGNSATASGGAVWDSAGSPSLVGCALVNNSAPAGGGVRTSGSVLALENCTLSANSATGGSGGGGVLAEDASELNVANTILYGDSGSPGAEMRLTGGGLLFISYTDLKGGQPGIASEGGSTVVWLSGNIDADPKFMSASNVRLAPDGPCIDAGNNGAVPGTLKNDPDGTPRFVDDPTTVDTGVGTPPIVDMGAYEYRCPADCNTDGKLNINDFICFQAKWRAKEFYGDFDGSGTYTINDFIRFQASFVRGCP